MSKVYAVAGALLLVFYVYIENRGAVFGSADERSALPAEAKSSRGYRSHGFWYVGYHGGK